MTARETEGSGVPWRMYRTKAGVRATQSPSDPHGHDDVAVLVVVAGVFRAELASGLGVLEFQADFAGVSGLEEIEQVLRIKADGQQLALVVGLDGILGFAGLGGRRGDFQLVLVETQADGTGAL